MAVPAPGTPILQVIQGGLGKASSYRIGQNAGNLLPQGPINSTLQSLSPAQYAALGLAGVGVVGVGASAYQRLSDPQEGAQTVPDPNDQGTFGPPPDKNYVIRTYLAGTNTLQPPGNQNVLFGHNVKPSIEEIAPGEFSWRFDYKRVNDSRDFSLQLGLFGLAYRWGSGQTPLDYRVFLSSDVTTPLTPYIPPGTIEIANPIAPSPLVAPGDFNPVEADEEQKAATEGIEVTLDEISALTDALTETLTENLPCNICDLVGNNDVAQNLTLDQIKLATDEIIRRTAFTLDATVDTGPCEGPEQLVTVSGDTLQEFALLVAAISSIADLVKVNSCEIQGGNCAIPEGWRPPSEPETPQVILRMSESSTGHSGTPKPRDFTLPNYNAPFPDTFPSWQRGDYRVTVKGELHTRITVYSTSFEVAKSIVDQLADKCDGFTQRTYTEGRRAGYVQNSVLLEPFKMLRFPQGKSSGAEPSQIYNFRTQAIWP